MDLHILKIIPHDSSLDIFLQIDKICPQKEVFNLFLLILQWDIQNRLPERNLRFKNQVC